jgi:RNA-directed DNA polymerase
VSSGFLASALGPWQHPSGNPGEARRLPYWCIAGWINYYGRYYRTALDPLLNRVNAYLRRWAGRKYKRLRTDKRFRGWGTGLFARQPDLFIHWRVVRTYYG